MLPKGRRQKPMPGDYVLNKMTNQIGIVNYNKLGHIKLYGSQHLYDESLFRLLPRPGSNNVVNLKEKQK
jgi:hypothetical protein